MKKAVLWAGGLVLAQWTGAAVLLSESFDGAVAKKYNSGDMIQSSGSGASKCWKAWAAKGGGLIEIKAPGLSGKDGQSLILGGSADENKGTAQIFCIPDAPVDFSVDGVYYMSFLFKNLDSSKVSSDFTQLALKHDEGNIPLTAAGMNSDEKVMGVAGKTQGSGTAQIETGLVYRFVVKLVVRASDPDQVCVSAFKLKEVPAQEPQKWDDEISAEAAGLADKLMFMVSFGNNKVMYDDLKIGTAYTDVISN